MLGQPAKNTEASQEVRKESPNSAREELKKLGTAMSRRVPRRGGSRSTPSGKDSPTSKTRSKPVACRRCHARKVKCSAGTPCQGCIKAHCEIECVYPQRDRQVRVSQSYIDRLLAENEQLRDRQNKDEQQPIIASIRHPETASSSELTEGPVHNPLFEDRPWFLRIGMSDAPALIGEAADAAFATRFRQVLSETQLSHILRMNYPSDDTILSLSNPRAVSIPSLGKARFLVRSALTAIAGRYHMVLKSAMVEGLERFLDNPTDCGFFLSCKVWALFALGELYSTRSVSSEIAFPGLAYFAQATKVMQALQERPCIDSIEVLLLLSLYALSSNRRHSACFLAGSAVRLGVIMGLHLNIPEAQLNDRAKREHRNRIWWTAYIFDHFMASRLGQSASIQNLDIQVDLPSNTGLPGNVMGDFTDIDSLVAHVKLAELAGQVTQSLYGRGTQREPFSKRVQQALKKLQGWVRNLPDFLQFEMSQSSQPVPPQIRFLHLTFNQCMILATRPVLLYILSIRRQAQRDTVSHPQPAIPENVQALAEACICCSRHSYSLLMECWIDGSFSTFGYCNTQYLFSAATILAISALLGGPRSSKDEEDFELATQLLADLKQNGSFTAMEFCQHIAAMKTTIAAIPSRFPGQQQAGYLPDSNISLPEQAEMACQLTDLSYASSFMTAEMALAEPSVQAFLSQADPSFQHLDLSMLDSDLGSFYWPNDSM